MLTKTRTLILILLIGLIGFTLMPKQGHLPLVAIANYGPHASLDASIQGIKEALAKKGYLEHQTVTYVVEDVGFDASLIPQMIAELKNRHPQVMVVLTTPVAQFAKGTVKDIPLIYDVITDPIDAGLIQDKRRVDGNMTGSSDKQDLNLVLQFAKQLIPKAHRIGLLYATSEANDKALLHEMQRAAEKAGMDVVAVPVSEARDVPMLMQQFKARVDVIYVGASGPIQPTLPVISAMSKHMKIPVLNVDESAVKEGQVLASFGVDYHQVGVHAGNLVASVLRDKQAPLRKPVYPTQQDHHGFINVTLAHELGLIVPVGLAHVSLVE